MIAPIETYRPSERIHQQIGGGTIESVRDTKPQDARLSTTKLIGDNPVVAVVAAITLGVGLGWLLKRKLV